MNKKRRHRKEKNGKSFLFKLLGWVFVLAVISGAIWFAVSQTADSEEDLLKSMYPTEYSEYVEASAEKHQLDKALVYGVIKTESNFEPEAESHVGAVGLMQMMPETFNWLQEYRGAEGTYTITDLETPEVNIDYGCYFLKYLCDYYGNEQCAVAAYNAGFVVDQWLEDPEYSNDGKTLYDIPYPETSNYVDKVFEAKDMYNELYFK